MTKIEIASCCRNCNNREIGCHAKCEAYITAKQEYESEIQKRKQAKLKEKVVNDTLYQGKLRKKGLKR